MEVEEDDVGPVIAEHGPELPRVRRASDPGETVAVEDGLDEGDVGGLVVHDEDVGAPQQTLIEVHRLPLIPSPAALGRRRHRDDTSVFGRRESGLE
jgi:hypothetical protein